LKKVATFCFFKLQDARGTWYLCRQTLKKQSSRLKKRKWFIHILDTERNLCCTLKS
jgi:hypothetical protein